MDQVPRSPSTAMPIKGNVEIAWYSRQCLKP